MQYQLPQISHAISEFVLKNADIAKRWNAESNSLIVLATKDEESLCDLLKKAEQNNIICSGFFEPDIGYELTAIVLEPSEKTKKLCSNLPLAGKKILDTAQELLNQKRDIVRNMQGCYQTPTQNILEHGLSVWNRFQILSKALENHNLESVAQEWRIPGWLSENRELFLKETTRKYSEWFLKTYMIWHDLGKGYCVTTDECGRQHFPNHAEASSKIFKTISNNKQIAWLIEHDMDIHMLKPSEEKQYAETNAATIHLQLVVSLCELHSNAELFGGIESDGFKIKSKRLNKIAKAIFNIINVEI